MAQNIHLKDRVRFLPTTKKKDLPPMFDCNFVATIPFYSAAKLPGSFQEWNEDGFGNYSSIIGSSGDALISSIDLGIWSVGEIAGSLNVINGSLDNFYPVYYNTETNPATGGHSGFMFYTIYDIQLALDPIAGLPTYSVMVDVWESRVLINDATTYDDIK